jgi:hypothetical protein
LHLRFPSLSPLGFRVPPLRSLRPEKNPKPCNLAAGDYRRHVRDPYLLLPLRDPVLHPRLRDPLLYPVLRHALVHPRIRCVVVDADIRHPAVVVRVWESVPDSVVRDPVFDPRFRNPVLDPGVWGLVVGARFWDPGVRDYVLSSVFRFSIWDTVDDLSVRRGVFFTVALALRVPAAGDAVPIAVRADGWGWRTDLYPDGPRRSASTLLFGPRYPGLRLWNRCLYDMRRVNRFADSE